MRSYFLYNKENGVVKQTNLSRICFRPSSRKSKQLFKTRNKVQILKYEVPLVFIFCCFFFSKVDLVQIDKIPRNMKRAQYKRWIHLVNSAQLDRH